MKIAIVAGGTGGHIYPATTLGAALKERGHHVTFFGSIDRMESEVIPSLGFEFIGLSITSTQGSAYDKVKSLLSMNYAYDRCMKILKDYDMAIGFGNYISIPVMAAAKNLGLKTVIHEQNSFVGKANRFLDKRVDLIIASYEENRSQFKNPNIKVLGNPQASKAFHGEREEGYLPSLGLKNDRQTVVIFMGSLGSESVNRVLLDYFKLLKGDYQVLYATGKEYYEEDKKEVKETEYLRLYQRIDGIQAMRNADLLVSRAGATTLCEIMALGMPAILIPSPYVPNNHQYYNAKALVDKAAAEMIEESRLSANALNEKIETLLADKERRLELSRNARSMANENVLEDIVKEIEAL